MGDDLEENWSVDDASSRVEDADEEEIVEQKPTRKRKVEKEDKNPPQKHSKKEIVVTPSNKNGGKTELLNLPSEQQADYFWNEYSTVFEPQSSVLEKDTKLSGKDFVSVQFELPRTVENFQEFVKTMEPEWKQLFCLPDYPDSKVERKKKGEKGKKDVKGAPILLVLCASALRAADIVRTMKSFTEGEVKIGKLFAKHIKVTQQSKFLSENITKVCVGTPNRIMKLIEFGSLKLHHLKYILIDATFKNPKNFNIFEQYDTKTDLFTLYHKHLLDLIVHAQAKLCLY